jgi:tuberous sclerosis protein 2
MRIQNKLDILATPQMSDDYDHSLLGLNKPISYLDEEDENGEWGILTMDGDDDDVIGNDNTTDLSHDLEGQSHDIKERSHDLEGQSHDIKEQSHDLEEQSHDADTQPEDIQQKQSSCDLEKLLHDTASEMHFDDIVEPSNSKTSPESNKNEKRVQIKLEEKTSPLQRHPNSQSWSEGRSETLAVVNMSSRSNSLSSSSFEHFPPLFSYDKGHLLCRSPSLVSGLLSDPQQLQLMTSASKSNTIAPHLINDDDDIDGFDEEPLSFLPDSGNTDDKCEEEPLRESSFIETTSNHITNTEDTTTIPNINLSDSSTPDITALPSVVPTTIEEDTNTPSKKYSSTPSKARKRVMFSKHDTSASSIRDDTSTAIFNNPSFIFLQLYHSGAMGTHSTDAPPLLLPPSETIDRALKVLDHIPPYNTHKIGVIYVGEGQSTEQEILSNTSGSSRYLTLIKGLGRTINLSECTSDLIYLGGLDTDGADGQLTCYWEDDITQVIFHVATLMPTVASNPNCSNKKLHIGNNFVTIVYNDSESPFQFGTIKGQFNYAEVIVQPLTCGMNCVSLAVKKGLDKLIDCSSTLISDKWLPILVRQKALLANLASLVLLSQASHDHYPSNWLGRLKQIRRIREKILSDSSSDKRNNVPSNVTNNDFTLYC